MQQPDAETIALQVLAWLAGEDELLGVFLASSGTAPDSLRARAAEPEFLAGVLDFVLLDDAWTVPAAAAAGVSPDRLARARAALPGGAVPDWG